MDNFEIAFDNKILDKIGNKNLIKIIEKNCNLGYMNY